VRTEKLGNINQYSSLTQLFLRENVERHKNIVIAGTDDQRIKYMKKVLYRHETG